jgi:hypothetical protein
MRREMPMWLTVGMNTTLRPGSEMYVVMRAPLLEIGSLTTWTRISWPGRTSSVMSACLPVRRGTLSPSSSSMGAGAGGAPEAAPGAAMSPAYRNAALSSPMSTKAACIPGRTRRTLPLYTFPTVPRSRSRST